ncbi:hypothetical protein F5Y14DRAFT_412249 [Nemania sp. NC0429]|nr:hypothetical protein F5Y14DRAFT_412249 [Nemania sp. NC0429]
MSTLNSELNNPKMDYIVTGSWSQKAAAEAEQLFGPEHVNIAANSRKTNNGGFGTISDETTWNLSKRVALVFCCDNETVDGVEFPGFPKRLEPGPGTVTNEYLLRHRGWRCRRGSFSGARGGPGADGASRPP